MDQGVEFIARIDANDLDEREREVLSLVVRGYRTTDIAATLHISPQYVYLLMRQLRYRFLVKTNEAMVGRAIALGVVSTDGKLNGISQ
jgi:DNA-binding CsgD family transcriptional regulator